MIIQRVLMITFDFTQRGKSGTGLAAGCLLAACKAHHTYGERFTIDHLPVMMSENIRTDVSDIIKVVTEFTFFENLTHIALACYVWSDYLIEPLIQALRSKGFSGRFILGGYEIHSESCRSKYPSGDAYLVGNAETSLIEAILDDAIVGKKIYQGNGQAEKFQSLPSPYLTDVIPLKENQEMIHWETARGCNFKCNFCLHRDVAGEPVRNRDLSRVKHELTLFHEKGVRKINVLDPIFNNPKSDHLEILQYCVDIGLQAELNLQVRFEFITDEFLAICCALNVTLEFGLQTAIPIEYKVIDRPNNLRIVAEKILKLHRHKIPFQVSLIYGLPMQTVGSFKASVAFLKDQGVRNVVAFPLMLLEGTKLKAEADRWDLVEKVVDQSFIPHVVSSSTFSEADYRIMQKIARQLKHTSIAEVA